MSDKNMLEKIRTLPAMKRHFLCAAFGVVLLVPLAAGLSPLLLGITAALTMITLSKRDNETKSAFMKADVGDVLKNFGANMVSFYIVGTLAIGLFGEAPAQDEPHSLQDQSSLEVNQTTDMAQNRLTQINQGQSAVFASPA